MKLDLVHDIQSSYRKVLNCMSRPGFIDNIQDIGEKVDLGIEFYKPTLVTMLMLLDAEVSFKIVSDKEGEITEFVSQLTYSKASSIEEADYIFIMSDADENEIELAFRSAKIGNLIDPEKSASIIMEVEKLSNDKKLMLKGPGIEEANFVSISAAGGWIEERENKNIEYPLGIDILFIDSFSNIMCIPRTTKLSILSLS